ncbi:MAG: pseudouridine synthase [Hyphomicrobiales bacterium]
MAVERLQKILSNAGKASRREAEEMILAGRVAVNGEVQTTLGARADPDTDEITVDGEPVVLDRYRYFLLNKPGGFVTTRSDELQRETVLDLVPIGEVQLHPVGRLDMDSEGLLLLTNDGHLTDLLTHPRYEVEKEYLVGIDAPISSTDLKRLVRGVESQGERLRAVSAQQALAPTPGLGEEEPAAPSWLLLTLREGKNREIRRMMAAIGREVLLLRRIRLGPLHLGNLGSGAFRELTHEEVAALYNAGRQAERRAAAAAGEDARAGTHGASFVAKPAAPRGRRARAGESPRTAPARPAAPGPKAPSGRTRFATPPLREPGAVKGGPKRVNGKPAGGSAAKGGRPAGGGKAAPGGRAQGPARRGGKPGGSGSPRPKPGPRGRRP